MCFKRHEKNLTEESIQMANQHMKRFSKSLAIKTMQSKTTVSAVGVKI